MIIDNRRRDIGVGRTIKARDIPTELLADGPANPEYRWFIEQSRGGSLPCLHHGNSDTRAMISSGSKTQRSLSGLLEVMERARQGHWHRQAVVSDAVISRSSYR